MACNWRSQQEAREFSGRTLSGEDAGLLHLDEEVEPVTIRLELPRAERSSASDLGQVYLASMHQSFVPLSELVRVRE
ncbi:MAG: efflux RND transporter permease subunit, partial [bacterium]|nr:efflux RND transporter permease subunit [bacterium]